MNLIYVIVEFEANRREENDKIELVISDYTDLCSKRCALSSELDKNHTELAEIVSEPVSFFGLYDMSYSSLVLRLADVWVSNFILKTMQLNQIPIGNGKGFPNGLEELATLPINLIAKMESKLEDEINLLRSALKSEAIRLSCHLKKCGHLVSEKRMFLDELSSKQVAIIDYLQKTRENQSQRQIADAINVNLDSDLKRSLRELKTLGLAESPPNNRGYSLTEHGRQISWKTGEDWKRS